MGHALGALSAASGFLFASALGGATSVLYGIGAAAAIIGVLVAAYYVAKNKTDLNIARGAAASWESERNAAVAKADRLEEQLRDEMAARKVAEARTDLTHLERMVASQHQDVVAVLNAIKDTLQILAAKGS